MIDYYLIDMTFAALLSWGVRESTIINNVLTVVNLLTVSTVVVSGLFKGNIYFDVNRKSSVLINDNDTLH